MITNTLLKKSELISLPKKIGSYSQDDVIFLLKDISHLIIEKSSEEREERIQNGEHYSEMLPIEYQPSNEYINVFHETLNDTSYKIAKSVASVSEQILNNHKDKNIKNIILVSLARAGIPIGILVKRYIKFKYSINLSHYGISIIRDKGIDENAVFWILKNHPKCEIQFIDGWTGKGMINTALNDACNMFYSKYNFKLNSNLAVLSDPACCVKTFGTREDFLIPSACLNSTISGLLSRTVFRSDLIFENDFHGVKYYKEWENIDFSNYFIDKISELFYQITDLNLDFNKDVIILNVGMKNAISIKEKFDIDNINLIKPGVGETTRVLLRRVPWKILVNDMKNKNLKHILILAKEKNVPIEVYKDMAFSCCGIIKSKKSFLIN